MLSNISLVMPNPKHMLTASVFQRRNTDERGKRLRHYWLSTPYRGDKHSQKMWCITVGPYIDVGEDNMGTYPLILEYCGKF